MKDFGEDSYILQKLKKLSNLNVSNLTNWYTLLFYQIGPLKNGASLILPSSIARNSSAPTLQMLTDKRQTN